MEDLVTQQVILHGSENEGLYDFSSIENVEMATGSKDDQVTHDCMFAMHYNGVANSRIVSDSSSVVDDNSEVSVHYTVRGFSDKSCEQTTYDVSKSSCCLSEPNSGSLLCGFNVCNTSVADSDLWHRRLGHQSSSVLAKCLNRSNIHVDNKFLFCEACQLGKSHKLSF